MRIRRTKFDICFDIFVYALLIGVGLATILPFMQVITISLSPPTEVLKYGLHLFPTKIDLAGYVRVLNRSDIWIGYKNTIIRTVLGTALSVTLYILGAYPLSKKFLPNRKLWTGIIIFTMYFQGGIIPSYLLVRSLGLMDTMGALILPGAVSAFTLIVVRNFFMGLPAELEESAQIDGAHQFRILIQIIIPLSMPIIATVSLMSAVWHWNNWFDCMLYIKNSNKFVLQYILRQIILSGQAIDTNSTQVYVNTDSMKMAALMVATLPIICVYPFLQKYFVKGMLVGSVKG